MRAKEQKEEPNMIWIFNLERASAGLCDNYDDVVQYITQLENIKLPANHRKSIYSLNMSGSQSEKKQWCIDFCNSNSYIIVETPSKPMDSKSTQSNMPFQSLCAESGF
jgi:hypothetical protein